MRPPTPREASEGWILHDGGENPLPRQRVDVRFSSGIKRLDFDSESWTWPHGQSRLTDVWMYRPAWKLGVPPEIKLVDYRDLKPCPFCGGTEITPEFLIHDDVRFAHIRCLDCNSSQGRWNDHPIQGAEQTAFPDAADAWNRRPTPKPVQESML